jgi:hypothetical protein
MRFEIEPEYVLEKGCRCCSCFEPSGRWLVTDIKDKIEDQYFATEAEAQEWVVLQNYKNHTEGERLANLKDEE